MLLIWVDEAPGKLAAILNGAAVPVHNGSLVAQPNDMVGIDSVPKICCHKFTCDQVPPAEIWCEPLTQETVSPISLYGPLRRCGLKVLANVTSLRLRP